MEFCVLQVLVYHVSGKSRSVHKLKKIGIFHESVSFGFRDILEFVVVVVVLL